MHYDDLSYNFPTTECMEKIKSFLKRHKIVEQDLNKLIEIGDVDIRNLNDIEFLNIEIVGQTKAEKRKADEITGEIIIEKEEKEKKGKTLRSQFKKLKLSGYAAPKTVLTKSKQYVY